MFERAAASEENSRLIVMHLSQVAKGPNIELIIGARIDSMFSVTGFVENSRRSFIASQQPVLCARQY